MTHNPRMTPTLDPRPPKQQKGHLEFKLSKKHPLHNFLQNTKFTDLARCLILYLSRSLELEIKFRRKINQVKHGECAGRSHMIPEPEVKLKYLLSCSRD